MPPTQSRCSRTDAPDRAPFVFGPSRDADDTGNAGQRLLVLLKPDRWEWRGVPLNPDVVLWLADLERLAGTAPATPEPVVRWVTVADAARLLGLSARQTTAIARSLGGRKVGRRWLLDERAKCWKKPERGYRRLTAADKTRTWLDGHVNTEVCARAPFIARGRDNRATTVAAGVLLTRGSHPVAIAATRNERELTSGV